MNMNKLSNIILMTLALSFAAGCDKFFDDVECLDKVSGDNLTSTDGGMKALLANVYSLTPIEDFAYRPNTGFNCHNYDGVNGTTNIAFLSDEAARSEGGGDIVDGVSYWAYSDIRQVNIFLQTIESARNKGSVSEEDAARMSAEAHFSRGYMYFEMAKRFGGVPIIDHVQDGEYDPSGPTKLRVARSTEADTWDFIISEFDKAAEGLPETEDGYRYTKWAALGMKSRAALFAASVAKFGHKATLKGDAVDQKLVGIDASLASKYYQECIDACSEIIGKSGKSLYGANPTSVSAARENFQQLFLTAPWQEVILAKAYVDGTTNSNQGHSWSLFYSLAQFNPGALRYGRFSPTLDLVDLFEDYTDDGQGKSAPIKTRSDGVEENVPQIQLSGRFDPDAPYIHYPDLSSPFENKDARLGASVIVPGASYNDIKIIMQGGLIDQDGKAYIYNNTPAVGKDGKTYYAFGAEGSASYSGFGNIGQSENGNYTTSGFSVRKYMEEGKTLSSEYNSVTTTFIDIRLSEIYLNYAEAVAESGQGDASKAAKYLNAIRHRAGHSDNIALTADNVQKERRVELAFEGKRYWDMIRRRENHEYFDSGMRSALVPMIDLRTNPASYIFVRANFHGDELQNGRTFNPQSYYMSIPGTATNGLVQNPGY